MNSKKVFISYSRQDKQKVLSIVRDIEKALGIQCWLDIDGIESGELFEDKIVNAINNAEVVLLMLSHNSVKSSCVREEFEYALKTEKRIVPLIIDGYQLKDWYLFKFGRTDYIDTLNEDHIQKLIRNLRSWIVPDVKAEIVEEVVAKPTEPQDLNTLGLKEMRQRANGGDPECQYLLGLRYLDGSDGLKQNSTHAVMWLNKAASSGNASAQCLLGEYYEEQSKYDKSGHWYRLACGLGHSRAALRLGHMYEIGAGVSKDLKIALEYYKKALDMGEPAAKKYYDMLVGAAMVSISRIRIQQVKSDAPVVRFTVKIKGENLNGYHMRCLITFKPDVPLNKSLEVAPVPAEFNYKGILGKFAKFSPEQDGEVVNDFSFDIPCRILSDYGKKGEWPLIATITILSEDGDKLNELTRKDKRFYLRSRKHILSRKVVYELQKQ